MTGAGGDGASRGTFGEGHRVGMSLMKSEEADAVIDCLRDELGDALEVADHGPYYRIEADDKLEVRFADVSDLLGHPFTSNDFHTVFASYYGRPVANEEMIGIYAEMLGLADHSVGNPPADQHREGSTDG